MTKICNIKLMAIIIIIFYPCMSDITTDHTALNVFIHPEVFVKILCNIKIIWSLFSYKKIYMLKSIHSFAVLINLIYFFFDTRKTNFVSLHGLIILSISILHVPRGFCLVYYSDCSLCGPVCVCICKQNKLIIMHTCNSFQLTAQHGHDLGSARPL